MLAKGLFSKILQEKDSIRKWKVKADNHIQATPNLAIRISEMILMQLHLFLQVKMIVKPKSSKIELDRTRMNIWVIQYAWLKMKTKKPH